ALRAALGSLNVTPLDFASPVSALLVNTYLGSGPRNLVVGRECKMVDAAGTGASVNWNDIDILDGSVRRHVRDGLKIDRLALSYGEVMSFVLDQQMVLRKIRISGDELSDDTEEEEPLARLDARLVLFAGTLSRLMLGLKQALGGYA
ncbi:MAG: recombination-associated protein RdgC, partial [Pseudomonadales bacterium]|nr:recombination-associated protein RdgC [Pseudomonadales bacterium]